MREIARADAKHLSLFELPNHSQSRSEIAVIWIQPLAHFILQPLFAARVLQRFGREVREPLRMLAEIGAQNR